jgi:dTDP-glucose pyrophosphorylase
MNPEDLFVGEGATVREALERVSKTGKGLTLVVDGQRRLVGIATDGDLRKAILRGAPLDAGIESAVNRAPVVVRSGIAAADALALMRQRGFRHLPAVDDQGRVVELLLLDELMAPPAPLKIPAVIMAGGEGKRLRPLTEATPKPLLRVGGKPLIELMIEHLHRSGLTDVIVAVHHKSQMIRDYLGDGSRLGVRLTYVEESRPLGTMGALTLVRDRLEPGALVVNADILTKCDFRAMWAFHRRQGPPAMTVGVSLHQVEIPYGEFTLRDDRVLAVDEKPRKEYQINTGIYMLEAGAIDQIPRDVYFDATDLIHALLRAGRPVAAYAIREYWLDVGRQLDFEKANRDVAEGLLE